MHRIASAAALFVALAIASPRVSSAYQIDTAYTSSCHERITLAALDRVGWPQSPPALDDDLRTVIDLLPFGLPDSHHNLWAVSLLVGVRYNDIEDRDPTNLPSLAQIHNRNDNQPEHCLRQKAHDGPDGDDPALLACRAFIVHQVLMGLPETGGPRDALDQTVEVDTYLDFVEQTDLELSRHAFHVGRALHALQDSYTHTFRNPDSGDVRHVLNWIDGNVGNHELRRDGHPHMSSLDDCTLDDPVIRGAQDRAVEASADLLQAAYLDASSEDERRDAVHSVLDERLAREEQCSVDNGWCNAPEPTLGSGCSASRGTSLLGSALFVAALLLVLPGGHCRRRLRGRARRLRWIVSAAAALPLLWVSADARGDVVEKEVREESSDEAEAELSRQEASMDAMEDVVKDPFGLSLSVGASIDRGGAAAAGGLRWNINNTFALGLDLEYNPWISNTTLDTEEGTVNLYVPFMIDWANFGAWTLRTSAGLGASYLLTDLVGAEKGTIGAYGRLNPLGVTLPLGSSTKLVIKPGDIAVPVPQLSGIPYYYVQYRATVGLEWYGI